MATYVIHITDEELSERELAYARDRHARWFEGWDGKRSNANVAARDRAVLVRFIEAKLRAAGCVLSGAAAATPPREAEVGWTDRGES